MEKLNKNRPSPAKEIACIAVETALLIGAQYAISPVMGVEVVTVLLLTFSWVFGRRAGALTAVCFSLLRCMLSGFYPQVIVLYLVYYPLFAVLFGSLGRVSDESYVRLPVWAVCLVNIVLAVVCAVCVFCAATDFLKISRLSVVLVKTLLSVVAVLSFALMAALDISVLLARAGKIRGAGAVKTVLAAAIAAICTIFFTLLDDFIAPLFLGYGLFSESWGVYFYGSFLALAPQTVCAIVTVALLFLPLTSIFKKVAK